MAFSIINSGMRLGIMGVETLTVSNSVQVCTPSVYIKTVTEGGDADNNVVDRTTARRAFVTVETAGIHAYFDGTSPDATHGHYFAAGDSFEMTSQDQIVNFKAYRSGGSDATIAVTYFG